MRTRGGVGGISGAGGKPVQNERGKERKEALRESGPSIYLSGWDVQVASARLRNRDARKKG